MAVRREGFEYEPKLYRLRFENDLAGLEVEALGPSIGGLRRVIRLTGRLDELAGEDGREAELLEAAAELFAEFGSYLQDWNLKVRGEPVPATAQALADLDLDFGVAVIRAWVEAVSAVDPTSLPGSSGGPPSDPGLSLPMAPLSPRPPS